MLKLNEDYTIYTTLTPREEDILFDRSANHTKPTVCDMTQIVSNNPNNKPIFTASVYHTTDGVVDRYSHIGHHCTASTAEEAAYLAIKRGQSCEKETNVKKTKATSSVQE